MRVKIAINFRLKYFEVGGASFPINMMVKIAINVRLKYIEVGGASFPINPYSTNVENRVSS